MFHQSRVLLSRCHVMSVVVALVWGSSQDTGAPLPQLDDNLFDDSILFDVKWPGTSAVEKSQEAPEEAKNYIKMISSDKEEYMCELPSTSLQKSGKVTYDEDRTPTPEQLLEPLLTRTSCTYRLESYWSYELCHGKSLRQYHEEKTGSKTTVSLEYDLGKERLKGEEGVYLPGETGTQTIEGEEFPYFAITLGGGTSCDLTGVPRLAKVKYVCHRGSQGEIYEVKETRTCEYEVVALTHALCSHPFFRPRENVKNNINCVPAQGSPRHPARYTALQRAGPAPRPVTFAVEDDTPQEEQYRPSQGSPSPTKATPPARSSKDQGQAADKQLLREFLAGDYCLFGGSGWWKHEFCYGKHALQYHEEPTGRTEVLLGFWDEEAHMRWIQKHPHKRPRPADRRTQIHLYYVNGDVCDVTGTRRNVEVKLRCVVKPESPHSVSIYLTEPTTCNYILVVESPLLCPVIEKADDNGIISSSP